VHLQQLFWHLRQLEHQLTFLLRLLPCQLLSLHLPPPSLEQQQPSLHQPQLLHLAQL